MKHQGRIFHVQTEDSGVSRPHIITHLFADGGRIIKSTRTDYSEHLGRADMSSVVRQLMKEQHKAMFIALRDGQLNETIDKVLGPVPSAPASPEPASSEPASSEPAAPSAARPPPLPAKRRGRPNPTLPELDAATPASIPPEPEVIHVSATSPVPKRVAPTLTDLVLADLESARARGPEQAPAGKPVPKGVPGVPSSRSQSGRYAASRPAAIFTANAERGSIFGGSSISEQSLDEVILSYLAEDLDGPPEE